MALRIVKMQSLPKSKSWGALLGGAICLIGGGALMVNRRPVHGGVLMGIGAYISMTTANARRAAPLLLFGSLATFVSIAYVIEVENRRIQHLVQISQPIVLKKINPRLQFEDTLPMPYFHSLTKPRYTKSNWNRNIALEIVGVERDTREGTVEYTRVLITAHRSFPLAAYEITAVEIL